MDNKLSELKAAALAATPGPWRAISFDDRLGISGDGNATLVCEHITKQRPQDALFIAAANPAAVLALLAELEAKEKRLAELEAKLATPVRLPEGLAQKIKVTGYYEALNEMMNCIRAAGFKV